MCAKQSVAAGQSRSGIAAEREAPPEAQSLGGRNGNSNPVNGTPASAACQEKTEKKKARWKFFRGPFAPMPWAIIDRLGCRRALVWAYLTRCLEHDAVTGGVKETAIATIAGVTEKTVRADLKALTQGGFLAACGRAKSKAKRFTLLLDGKPITRKEACDGSSRWLRAPLALLYAEDLSAGARCLVAYRASLRNAVTGETTRRALGLCDRHVLKKLYNEAWLAGWLSWAQKLGGKRWVSIHVPGKPVESPQPLSRGVAESSVGGPGESRPVESPHQTGRIPTPNRSNPHGHYIEGSCKRYPVRGFAVHDLPNPPENQEKPLTDSQTESQQPAVSTPGDESAYLYTDHVIWKDGKPTTLSVADSAPEMGSVGEILGPLKSRFLERACRNTGRIPELTPVGQGVAS